MPCIVTWFALAIQCISILIYKLLQMDGIISVCIHVTDWCYSDIHYLNLKLFSLKISNFEAVKRMFACLGNNDGGGGTHWHNIDLHDDVIKWKHFPRYWPFVRGIHRSPVNSPHKGQWRGALMFTLICARINGWVNNPEAGDLWRHRVHYDVIVMSCCVMW